MPCIAEVVNRSLKADCTDFMIVHRVSEILFLLQNEDSYFIMSPNNPPKNMSWKVMDWETF